MTTTVKRIVAAPALYGFDAILNLTDEQIKSREYPESIRGWGWYSAVELREASITQLKRALKGGILAEHKTLEEQFRLAGFTDLNLPPDQFCWFIRYGEGILQVNRPPSACSFGDQELYVPALWGKKVMNAAARGFVAVKTEIDGNAVKNYGFRPDGSKEQVTASTF